MKTNRKNKSYPTAHLPSRAAWSHIKINPMKYKKVALTLLALTVFLAGATLSMAHQHSLTEQLVKANNAFFHQGDLKLADELFSTDFVVHGPGGGTHLGPQAIREFVTAMRTAFPDLRVEVQVLLQKDNTIAWLRTHRGTFHSDFMGVKASGQVVSWREMIVSRYEDGRIAEEWAVTDFVEAASKKSEVAR